MFTIETAVAEPNGQSTGYSFEPSHGLEDSEQESSKSKNAVEPLDDGTKSVSAQCVAEPLPKPSPATKPTTDANATGKTGTAKSPRRPQPAKSNAATNSDSEGARIRYVPQAELDAEQTKLQKLSNAALGGNTAALDKLRAALNDCPHIWRRIADLQSMVEHKLIELAAGTDPLRVESFRKRCSELRHELLEGKSSSLATEMAASRVVTTFMFVQLLELRKLDSPNDLRCLKSLEQSERRFQGAMRTFLMARRSELQLSQVA